MCSYRVRYTLMTYEQKHMSDALTPKQKNILDYIVSYVSEKAVAPSYREIADEVGLTSPATVHQHIHALQRKGYVSLEDGPRSLKTTSKVFVAAKSYQLPLAGLITAGQPIEALEEHETIGVPAEFVRSSDSFVLKVKGVSMIEDGILDGDFVVVERNYYPNNGDVVVALLDNTFATLKKYFREKDRIRLQPANSTMKPIYAKNPSIQGIVRAVMRRYATM